MSGEQMTVGTVLQGQAALDALRKRALASSADRLNWLAVRRTRVTATEAAKMANGLPAVRRQILQDKLHPERVQSLAGNRYVDRGNAREGILASWAGERFPGMVGNDVLYAGLENPLHAATPDMVGVLTDGQFCMGKIKTSKHDLDPRLTGGHYWSNGYADQVQWQMYVTGARRCLFLWEQHDDQWPDPQPLDLEPQYVWVDYSPERVARMIAQADLLLAELHQEEAKQRHQRAVIEEAQRGTSGTAYVAPAPTVADVAQVDGGLKDAADLMGATVVEARKEEATAKARKDTAWKRLQTLLADQESYSHVGLSRVTWTNEVTVARVPDQEAALAAEGGQQLHDALVAAREAWDTHQAQFWKDRETSAQKLTVTDPDRKGQKR